MCGSNGVDSKEIFILSIVNNLTHTRHKLGSVVLAVNIFCVAARNVRFV
jgi:hypothetical protein